MKPYLAILVPAVLALCAASCNKPAESKHTIAFDTIEQEQSFRLVGSAADYGVDSDLVYSCEARMLMPSALCGDQTDTLRQVILKMAFDTLETSHTHLIEQAFHHAAAEVGYNPVDTVVPSGVYDGCFIVEGDVATLTPAILSYGVTVSNYQPYAAHGMYTTNFVNYDFADSRIFTLKDIFTQQGLDALPAMLKKTARDMRGFIGPTQLDSLPSGDNFYIDNRNNIVFVYQPYEIASYAQGLIEIPVPAYLVSDNFTDYGRQLLMN